MNADDFGRHPLINGAVKRGLVKGVLRSASLMAGEPAFDEAAAIAKENPALGVGVHITLADGRPVSDPAEVPTLVGADGCFRTDHKAFVRDYLRGRISRSDLRREITAQMEKILRAGIRPTHIDGHQHLHILPGIFSLVLELAEQHGIRAVRIPQVDAGEGNGFFEGTAADVIGRLGLYTLAGMARFLGRRHGFAMPDHFAGLVAGAAVDTAYCCRLARSLPEGTTEVMIHPGLDNQILQRATSWAHDFEAEYRALTAPETEAAFREQGIASVNYRQLWQD